MRRIAICALTLPALVPARRVIAIVERSASNNRIPNAATAVRLAKAAR
jgi:hypothetical protein